MRSTPHRHPLHVAHHHHLRLPQRLQAADQWHAATASHAAARSHAVGPARQRAGRSAHPSGSGSQLGAATAEYAMGVIAAVMIAALLLQFVLAGFFDDLLRSVFERALDLVVSMMTSAASGMSLTGLLTGTWSTLSTAAGESVGWGWDALVDGVREVASETASTGGSAWSGATRVVAPLLEAAGDGLRWAGGPISGAFR